MKTDNKFFYCAFLFVFFGAGVLYPADSRYALVIGNSNYRDRNISNLTNPSNDAADIASGLKDLGYNVTLKTNVPLREMLNAIRDFTGDLARSTDNEGFFWFAGHGLSVKNVHYLLPVDVDPTDDFSIPRTAFSVDDLMEEIGNARNRTNLIVIDACRNAVLPGSRSVGSRGLTVMSRDDYRIRGNKLIYSTMAGKVASDGVSGSRNSPFAQAFVAKMKEPESFDDVFLEIANETLRLTRGDQEPYALGAFALKSYSLNPKGVEAAQAAAIQAAVQAALAAQANQAAPAAGQEQAAARPVETAPDKPARVKPEPEPKAPRVPKERVPKEPKITDNDFALDGSKVLSLSTGALLYPSTFTEGSFGGNIKFTFFEKYGSYGDFFFIPNSFCFSVDILRGTKKVESHHSTMPKDGMEKFSGGIFSLGAMYKIRAGESQRFIISVGPSFDLFLLGMQFFYDGTRYNYRYDDVKADTRISCEPCIGINGGFGFRLNQQFSLDFNVSLKNTFSGKQIDLNTKNESGDSVAYKFGYSDSFNLFGAFLGVTMWFPR